MPVLSAHSRQDCNLVLHGDYRNVCPEGVTLYHTNDNPTSAVKRGLLYQCDLTSSNQSISFPVFSSPPQKKRQKISFRKSGLSSEPQLSLRREENSQGAVSVSSRTMSNAARPGILLCFSHSSHSKHHRFQAHFFSYLVVCWRLKDHHQPAVFCFFCFCQLQNHL